jgi:hypothetical protein
LFGEGGWAYEVFADDNAALGRKLVEEIGAEKVKVLGAERGYHAACVVDGAFGLRDGESMVAILEEMGEGETGS